MSVAMFTDTHHHQVLGAVVVLIAVEVMHVFMRLEASPDHVFNHHAMLILISGGGPDADVLLITYMPPALPKRMLVASRVRPIGAGETRASSGTVHPLRRQQFTATLAATALDHPLYDTKSMVVEDEVWRAN